MSHELFHTHPDAALRLDNGSRDRHLSAICTHTLRLIERNAHSEDMIVVGELSEIYDREHVTRNKQISVWILSDISSFLLNDLGSVKRAVSVCHRQVKIIISGLWSLAGLQVGCWFNVK